MTAPDLVSVIAAALEGHLGMERETWNIDPEYFREQARAVLAAISEAGAVEWGVRYEWINDQGHPDSEVAVKRTEALARLEAAFEGSVSTIGEIEGPGIAVVTRQVTTWTAVE